MNAHRHRALLLRQEFNTGKAGNGKGMHFHGYSRAGNSTANSSFDPHFLTGGRWCQVKRLQLETSHYSQLFAVLPHVNHHQADILHPQHKQGRCRREVGRQTKTTAGLLNARRRTGCFLYCCLSYSMLHVKHSAGCMFKVCVGLVAAQILAALLFRQMKALLPPHPLQHNPVEAATSRKNGPQALSSPAQAVICWQIL